MSKANLSSIHFNYHDPLFVTGGSVVQVWNCTRSHPISTFDWGIDSVIKVRFNPSEVLYSRGLKIDELGAGDIIGQECDVV